MQNETIHEFLIRELEIDQAQLEGHLFTGLLAKLTSDAIDTSSDLFDVCVEVDCSYGVQLLELCPPEKRAHLFRTLPVKCKGVCDK